MKKRPVSIIIIACIYIAAGVLGIAYHAHEINLQHPFEGEVVLPLAVRLLAIVAGIFMLRGCDWARWLALLWMAYHVVLSAFHSFEQAGMHAILLALFAYFLLRAPANTYFRPGTAPGS